MWPPGRPSPDDSGLTVCTVTRRTSTTHMGNGARPAGAVAISASGLWTTVRHGLRYPALAGGCPTRVQSAQRPAWREGGAHVTRPAMARRRKGAKGDGASFPHRPKGERLRAAVPPAVLRAAGCPVELRRIVDPPSVCDPKTGWVRPAYPVAWRDTDGEEAGVPGIGRPLLVSSPQAAGPAGVDQRPSALEARDSERLRRLPAERSCCRVDWFRCPADLEQVDLGELAPAALACTALA